VSHRASLDVSAPVLKAVTGWIARRRRRPGSRPAQRAGTVHTQGALLLRWLRHRLDVRTLAADAQLSIATAYRYLHEALDVVPAHAPDLSDVLARARAGALPFLCLDGTLVPTDRVAARAERGQHLWYSGKHHAFGGNVQSSSIRPASPCGSPTSAPAPPMTAPRPASSSCPRSIRTPPADCRGWPTRATPAPASVCTCRSATTPTGRCTPTTAATTG
jgi:hypothetical protein